MTEKMETELEDVVENIPIPPGPQVVKSSNEILCELFGAFNATPPPLDVTLPQDNPSSSLHKTKKKHKKQKKHKKIKKERRSSSSSSYESKKSITKKSKKDKIKSPKSKSVSSNKKKKRKLGKYSASDSDSDSDEPKKIKNKHNQEKLTAGDKIKIKKEKDTDGANLNFSVIPDSITENILKHAVSQIVDKVIDSTNLATGVNNIACMQVTNINFSDDVLKSKITVKEEPSNGVQLPKEALNITKDTNSSSELQTSDVPAKALPVADVFAEDLLDCGIDKDNAVVTGRLSFIYREYFKNKLGYMYHFSLNLKNEMKFLMLYLGVHVCFCGAILWS